MRRILLLIFVLIIIIIGLSFAVLNVDEVNVKYYFGHISAPLSLVIVLCITLGAVIGITSSLGIILKMKRDIARLHRTKSITEKEVANLRSLPIKEKH